jgi:hypothetical protein
MNSAHPDNSRTLPIVAQAQSTASPENSAVMVSAASERMKLSDRITIVLSALAFIASVLALYFQFFNKTESAKLHVASLTKEDLAPVSISLTFINDGDYPWSVLKCSLIGSKDQNLAQHVVLNSLTSAKQFTLKPGEMESLNVPADLRENTRVFMDSGERHLGIRLELLSREGKKRVVRYRLADVTVEPSRYIFRFAVRTFDLRRATEEQGAVIFKEDGNTYSFAR